MPRGGGGRGWGSTRKDYTLLRDGALPDVEGDVEADAGKGRGNTVFRLLGLAKEEALVCCSAIANCYIAANNKKAVPLKCKHVSNL